MKNKEERMIKAKNLLIISILFSLIFVVPGLCMAEGGGLRYSISVSKFENRSSWRGQWNLGDAYGAVLTDSLAKTGRFIVLGEKDMRREALQEQDLSASGRTAGGGKTVVTGQMTPAQLLIKGAITHFADGTSGGGVGVGFKGFRVGGSTSNSEINTVMYIIDSSTGQVLASKKCYGQASKTGLAFGATKGGFTGDIGGFKKTNAGKAVEKAVDEGVDFLTAMLEEIPWSGKVILKKGSSVYINRGTREGVFEGQVFVIGNSEVLRDPDTGEVLDQSFEKMGRIEVIKVKEKLSICKITQDSGIAKGMTVVPAN
jgi:curli biogenesis system outer membrane secretion channel CsgG